jgi:rod shape-determining protein MreC
VVSVFFLQWINILPSGWLTKIVAPVTGTVYGWGTGLGQWWHMVTNGQEVIQQKEYWQEQAQKYAQELATQSEIKRQDEQLSQLLNFSKTSSYKIVAGRLIGSGGIAKVGTRIIDRGSADGIAVGQPVVSAGGSLVGVVTEAWSQGASVTMLDSPQSRIAAVPMGRQSSGGILSGVHELGLTLTNIRPDEPLAKGDIIGTSGLQNGLPRGLIIGSVREVSQKEGELFQSAVIEPVVDIGNIVEVGVITNAP